VYDPYGGGKHRVTVVNSSNPNQLVNVNGVLYFVANDGTHGRELWKSNGTSTGTVLVKDIDPGSASSNCYDLANVNGVLCFSANDGTHGSELWKSNGTAAGTVLVKDINPGTTGSDPAYLTNVGGTLYFAANDGTHGRELWQSDGTAAGTVMVMDIYPGSLGSYPQSLAVSGGHLFFSADDGVHGYELWDPPISPALGMTAGRGMVAAPVTAPRPVDGVSSAAGVATMTVDLLFSQPGALPGLAWTAPALAWPGGDAPGHWALVQPASAPETDAALSLELSAELPSQPLPRPAAPVPAGGSVDGSAVALGGFSQELAEPMLAGRDSSPASDGLWVEWGRLRTT
jgi:ELWxxDGT repeat protein